MSRRSIGPRRYERDAGLGQGAATVLDHLIERAPRGDAPPGHPADVVAELAADDLGRRVGGVAATGIDARPGASAWASVDLPVPLSPPTAISAGGTGLSKRKARSR